MPIHHRQSGKALFRIFSRTLGLHVSFLTHCQEAAARICRGEVEHSGVGNVEDFTLHGLRLLSKLDSRKANNPRWNSMPAHVRPARSAVSWRWTHHGFAR